MPNRIKVVDIELSQPLQPVTGLEDYQIVQGLLWLRGTPLGFIRVPVTQGGCSPRAIAAAILPHYGWAFSRQLVLDRLSAPAEGWTIADLLRSAPAAPDVSLKVTVAFCPRRTDLDLRPALQALQQLDYPNLEILVVEAAPARDDLQQLVQTDYPQFHYLRTAAAGLNQARNLAIEKAQGEIVAFIDEHSIVHRGWAQAIACAFARNPEAVALTGLVVPDALETDAQHSFEQGYSFGRGFDRRWWQIDPTQPVPWTMLGTMQVGTGANMAYRRSLFQQLGGFNPALDVEDLTGGGGDLEMFCRVLLSGQVLMYEPSAVVRYRSPRDAESLRSLLTASISGLFAYLAAAAEAYPALRSQFTTLGLWKTARLLMSLLRPYGIPRHLIWAELQSVWRSRGRYWQARQGSAPAAAPLRLSAPAKHMAVRLVDLSQPIAPLTDLTDYRAARVFVTLADLPIGSVDVPSFGQPIGADRLRQAIADQLMLSLLAVPFRGKTDKAWTEAQAAVNQFLTPVEEPIAPLPPLPSQVPVSIVITTCDRPDDLVNCLRHVTQQQTDRPVEIVVADNRPASGLTPPVVAQFPGVKLVQEARPGGSYGRNAAIAATTGEIVVTVDDDVTVPPDWLEKLLAPMARPEVAAVMGNVLPRELDTPAQILFEKLQNGLSQGFQPFEADGNWLASFADRSPPTWDLGVSANSAFRASIFSHPQIGLMEETLGPGTPTSGAEENYLVYKILKAGYTLVYEPRAFAWHRHRRDLAAFYRQIKGQMKSGTAYNLTLWLREGDRRGLRQLVYELPRYYSRRIVERLLGKHNTPWGFLWQEISGYFSGYWGYWQSCQRVKRQGRSSPYVPVHERSDRQPAAPTMPPSLTPSRS